MLRLKLRSRRFNSKFCTWQMSCTSVGVLTCRHGIQIHRTWHSCTLQLMAPPTTWKIRFGQTTWYLLKDTHTSISGTLIYRGNIDTGYTDVHNSNVLFSNMRSAQALVWFIRPFWLPFWVFSRPLYSLYILIWWSYLARMVSGSQSDNFSKHSSSNWVY